MKKFHLIIALLVIGLWGCGKTQDQTTSIQEGRTATERPSVDLKPCDLLTKEMVASTFELNPQDIEGPVEAEVIKSTFQDKEIQTISCEYEWEGGKYTLDLTMNIGEAYDEIDGMAEKSFERIIRSMAKGVTGTTTQNGKTYSMTFQGNYERVQGVGELAAFRRAKGTAVPDQLMFTHKQHIYFVNVGMHPNGLMKPKEDAEKVLEVAKTLAQKIIAAH